MHYFQYIFVIYLALYISMPIDILRTYSSINSTQSYIHVYTFIYVCIYHIKINKIILLICYTVLLIFYSYMWLLGCDFVLYCFNWFPCIHKPIDLSFFPLLYTLCLIVSVWRERKVLMLCSVMSAVPGLSKKCLEMLDNFSYSFEVWGCKTDHK